MIKFIDYTLLDHYISDKEVEDFCKKARSYSPAAICIFPEKIHIAKSNLLYEELDRSDFWKPHAEKDSRSVMNVTWRLPNIKLEEKFLEEAMIAGLGGLKGHRSVGGIRASLYNGCPIESVEALVSFMRDFENCNR